MRPAAEVIDRAHAVRPRLGLPDDGAARVRSTDEAVVGEPVDDLGVRGEAGPEDDARLLRARRARVVARASARAQDGGRGARDGALGPAFGLPVGNGRLDDARLEEALLVFGGPGFDEDSPDAVAFLAGSQSRGLVDEDFLKEQ